jgi:hypothetical protein
VERYSKDALKIRKVSLRHVQIKLSQLQEVT